jgi:hypothetical protein
LHSQLHAKSNQIAYKSKVNLGGMQIQRKSGEDDDNIELEPSPQRGQDVRSSM